MSIFVLSLCELLLKKLNLVLFMIFLYVQEHAKGLIEEIEELLMKNKKLSKQKDEQQAALEDGTRRNIAMNRNIEEVLSERLRDC